MRTQSTISTPTTEQLILTADGQPASPSEYHVPSIVISETRRARFLATFACSWRKRATLSLGATALSLALVACGNAAQVQPAGKLLPVASNPAPVATGGPASGVISSTDNPAIAAVKLAGPAVVRVSNVGSGLGSGVIIDPRGYIVTNNHVVNGGGSYRVTLANGKQMDARLVGTDPADDLALLKVDGTNFPSITLGDSSALQVGQSVLAIGTPLGFTHTVTEGIVSALSRNVSEGNGATISGAVQTSAPINPGNSGGALVDLQGRLVGIPTLSAIDPEFNTPANGVSFAIPVNRVKEIAPQLIATGSVQHTGRPLLGVVLADVTSQVQQDNGLSVNQGALIEKVSSGGAAQRAGLRPGDVITALDSQTVAGTQEVQQILATKQPGQQIQVSIVRGSQTLKVTLTLGEVPAQQ